MALAGNLREFGLPDILQLISLQKKSGTLSLKKSNETVRLLFREGSIASAQSSKRHAGDRLGRALVRRGMLSVTDLKAAIEAHKISPSKLGSVLVNKKYVTAEQIQGILTEQITETVMTLFSWPSGAYEFTPGAVPLDKDIPLAVDAQHLMMESLRIIDEMTAGSENITLESVFVPTGKSTGELVEEAALILEHTDGKSDVNQIADQTGLDGFTTAKGLIAMAKSGHVVMQTKEDLAREPEPEEKLRKIPGLKYILHAIIALSIAASFVMHSFGVEGQMDTLRTAEDIELLRVQIEAEQYITGAYPVSIRKNDPWGTPYVYEIYPKGFSIISAGPDRLANTKDDIY